MVPASLNPLAPPALNYMQHCWRRSKRLLAPFPVQEGLTHTEKQRERERERERETQREREREKEREG